MPGGRPRNRLRIPEEQGRCTKEALAGGARTTSRNGKGCYLCWDVVCTEAPGLGKGMALSHRDKCAPLFLGPKDQRQPFLPPAPSSCSAHCSSGLRWGCWRETRPVWDRELEDLSPEPTKFTEGMPEEPGQMSTHMLGVYSLSRSEQLTCSAG